MTAAALDCAQLVFSWFALAWGGWWTLLALLALKRPAPAPGPRGLLDWVAVVPAHNEETLIARTVGSLVATGLEPSRVIVVADNCSDGTATVARETGATVIERHDDEARGKGYALDFALTFLGARSHRHDALAIVDADSEVNVEFFACLAARFETGASIVQAHYSGGPGDSPFARIRRLALGLVHWARPLGASRLALPTTLKGNGMAFRWEIIRNGFPGAGVTEDAAATLEYARRGVVVEFEPRARVSGLMANSYREAATQDLRWEGGRLAQSRTALALATRLAARGRIRAAYACLELASPPLTLLAFVAATAAVLGGVGFGSAVLGTVALGSVVAYIGLGLAAAKPCRADLAALVHAPRFVLYKALIYARLTRGKPRTWERTTR